MGVQGTTTTTTTATTRTRRETTSGDDEAARPLASGEAERGVAGGVEAKSEEAAAQRGTGEGTAMDLVVTPDSRGRSLGTGGIPVARTGGMRRTLHLDAEEVETMAKGEDSRPDLAPSSASFI